MDSPLRTETILFAVMSLVLCDYLHETLLLLSDKETPLCGIERIENIIQVE